MPKRKKKARKETRQPPSREQHLYIHSAVIGGYRFEDCHFRENGRAGIALGDGPSPPDEDLPVDILVHGSQRPMMIDAESASRTMIGGDGSIERLDGRLVHRPQQGTSKIFGYAGAKGKSVRCKCGFEAWVFFEWCSKCGRSLI